MTNELELKQSARTIAAAHAEAVKKIKQGYELLAEAQKHLSIIDAHFIDGFKETIEYFYRRQGLTVHKEVLFFIIESNTEKVALSFEHIGYIWLNYKHAMEKLSFKNAKDVLQKAHDFLNKKAIVKD